jgi:hypothetical protein
VISSPEYYICWGRYPRRSTTYAEGDILPGVQHMLRVISSPEYNIC